MGWGTRIQDPRYGINLFRIPDSGVKKAPDPGFRIQIGNTAITLHFLNKLSNYGTGTG
jgi:hypothetical protein